MIYYIFALRAEAKPFIEKLNLKKNTSYTRMEVFANDTVTALITGSGVMNAAMAVTELLSVEHANHADFVLNAGVCGYAGRTRAELGTPFLCNQIVDIGSEKIYYPDMLYTSPFEEMPLQTHYEICRGISQLPDTLVDMEASGVYRAAIRFLKTSQLAFIKVVSDYCDGNIPRRQDVEGLMAQNADEMIAWAEQVAAQLADEKQQGLTDGEREEVIRRAKKMGCSVTEMHRMLREQVYEKVSAQTYVRKL